MMMRERRTVKTRVTVTALKEMPQPGRTWRCNVKVLGLWFMSGAYTGEEFREREAVVTCEVKELT